MPRRKRELVLYGSVGSGSAAIEMALDAIGAPYRTVRASSWEPGPSLRELRRVNPLAQVPTLRLPDGTVMTESAAILVHLGLEHPEARILPPDSSARATSIRGLVYVAVNCYSLVGVIDHPERSIVGPRADDLARIDGAARSRLHRNWEVFADQFPATPHLAGDVPGGLDFLTVVVSRWGGARPHLRRARPGFAATLRRIERHPRVAPVLARHWPD